MFQNGNIQLESSNSIKEWHEEFLTEENIDKVRISTCPYSWYEVKEEYWRRVSIGSYD